MARRLDHMQPPRGPTTDQPKGRQRRADHVIAALHDRAGDLRDPMQVAQDLAIDFQKALVHEVMVLQPRKGTGVIGRPLATATIAFHRGQRILPCRPSARIACLDHQIPGKQPPVIGRDQIAALFFGNHGNEPAPLVGPELPSTTAVEPIQLALHRQENTAQRQIGHMTGMRLRIDQAKRRAPASAENRPAVDAKRMANALDISDQMPCGVGPHTGMGPRTATATLIEQDDPPQFRVEIPPHRGATAATRPTMQHNDRRSIGVAALLDIDVMPIANVQHTLIEGIDRREKMGDCALLAGELVHATPI